MKVFASTLAAFAIGQESSDKWTGFDYDYGFGDNTNLQKNQVSQAVFRFDTWITLFQDLNFHFDGPVNLTDWRILRTPEENVVQRIISYSVNLNISGNINFCRILAEFGFIGNYFCRLKNWAIQNHVWYTEFKYSRSPGIKPSHVLRHRLEKLS